MIYFLIENNNMDPILCDILDRVCITFLESNSLKYTNLNLIIQHHLAPESRIAASIFNKMFDKTKNSMYDNKNRQEQYFRYEWGVEMYKLIKNLDYKKLNFELKTNKEKNDKFNIELYEAWELLVHQFGVITEDSLELAYDTVDSQIQSTPIKNTLKKFIYDNKEHIFGVPLESLIIEFTKTNFKYLVGRVSSQNDILFS